MNVREFETYLKQVERARTAPDEDDDEEEYVVEIDEDSEETLLLATSLLEDAKRLLGFYGDQTLSAKLVLRDRETMLAAAEEIDQFLKALAKD